MISSPFTGVLAAALAVGYLTARPAHAQNQVANYGFGKPGTATYEHFSFWIKDGIRTDIHYAYGKDRKDILLRYAGATRRGQAGFRVRFPNGHTLSVTLAGNTLRVTDPAAAPKIFAWEYEGPINGVGTMCSVCAPNAAAALRLLRLHYVR